MMNDVYVCAEKVLFKFLSKVKVIGKIQFLVTHISNII